MMRHSYSEKELGKMAEIIIDNVPSKTLCLYGQMGAGKTTLIKAILRKLGANDSGKSPTFGLVNEYHYKDDSLLGYHFDFYRLNNEMEAYDMGFEDYLNQDCWIFIEWPEKIPSLIPSDATSVYMDIVDSSTREIRVGNR